MLAPGGMGAASGDEWRVRWLLLLKPAGGEDGPGDAEGEDGGSGVAGDEDMFEAETEVQREFCGWEDIAESQARGGAGCLLVYVGAVAVEDRVAGGIELLDVGTAGRITCEGFDIPACAVMVEEMAIADEQGDEDEMGLSRREILETGFETDLVAFCDGNTSMEEPSETGGRLAFHDQMGDFELGVESRREKDRECRQG